MVTPAWLGLPERLGDRRAWGLATQLYSVRSRRSWGVGDLADLAELAGWAARLGAGFVQVNPLHAAEPTAPMEPSPYLPTSRRFANPLYLRVEQVAEYADLPPADRAEAEALRAEVQERAAATDTIDRDASWAAKRAALRRVHAVPRSTERDAAYARVPGAGGAGTDRLRHLVRAGRGARRRLAGVAGRAAPPPLPRRAPPSWPRTRTRSTSTAGCSG